MFHTFTSKKHEVNNNYHNLKVQCWILRNLIFNIILIVLHSNLLALWYIIKKFSPDYVCYSTFTIFLMNVNCKAETNNERNLHQILHISFGMPAESWYRSIGSDLHIRNIRVPKSILFTSRDSAHYVSVNSFHMHNSCNQCALPETISRRALFLFTYSSMICLFICNKSLLVYTLFLATSQWYTIRSRVIHGKHAVQTPLQFISEFSPMSITTRCRLRLHGCCLSRILYWLVANRKCFFFYDCRFVTLTFSIPLD